MSNLEAAEEIAERFAGNFKSPDARWGWTISPSIERARAARPAKEKEVSVAVELRGPVVIEPITFSEHHSVNLGQEVTGYVELIDGIQTRIGELGIRYVDFDKLACWAEGLTGKAFGPARVKRLGIEKVFDALRAAALKLRLEPDPEQLEKLRNQIAENCQPRQVNQARMGRFHPSNKVIEDVLDHLARKKGGLAILNDAAKRARSNRARRSAETRKRRAAERSHHLDAGSSVLSA